MTVGIYGRKSVLSERGESVSNQTALCAAYIRSRPEFEGCRTELYIDDGFSGKDTNRPEFTRMMADVRAGRLGCVVCYRLDRISRSVMDFAPFLEELGKRAVPFICLREQFDTSTPIGRAMIYIASVFAQLERETIAERVRDNMLLLAKAGRWLGGTPPTGFTAVREAADIGGRRKTFSRLVLLPNGAETIRAVFDAYLTEKDVSAAAAKLADGGARFTAAGIRGILKNPVYCAADSDAARYFKSLGCSVCLPDLSGRYGILPFNRRNHAARGAPMNPPQLWIIAQGTHGAVVSGREWVKAQRALNARRRQTQALPMMGRRIICALCGADMRFKPRSGRYGGGDYICSRKLKSGSASCACPNLPSKNAELAARRELLEYAGAGDIPPEKLTREEAAELFAALCSAASWDGEKLRLFIK